MGVIDSLVFMERYFLSFFFFLTFFAAQAQDDYCDPKNLPPTQTQGGFRIVGESAGCAPFTVTIQKDADVISDSYIYDYRGGIPFDLGEAPRPATYPKQGSFRILQLGSKGAQGSIACQTVEVFEKPNFTARACSGRRVQVTIANDSIARRYDAFSIDWGGGNTERVAKSANMTASFIYPDASVRTITVTGIYMGKPINCDQPARQNIIPSNADLSAVKIKRVSTRNDGLVDILVGGATGVVAELQMRTGGSGAFNNTGQMLTRADTITLTVRNIDATKNTYCFKLSANDGCDNTGNSSSSTVCSTNLTATAQNRQNLLEWQEYPSSPEFVIYSFKRNTIAFKGVPTQTIVSDIDADVVCGEQYCYQMTVVHASGAESVSPLRCVKAISNEVPSPIVGPFVSVSEENDKIELNANEPKSGTTPVSYKVIVSRSIDNSGDFREVATLKNTFTYNDADVEPMNHSYCYTLQYENTCGNRSEPTEPVCSIRLYSKSPSSVDWTVNAPFTVPVGRYEILILDEQGGIFDSIEKGGNTSSEPGLNNTDQQLFRYRIAAYGEDVGPSYSNFFVFKRNAQMYVPTAFSPNNDAFNKTFFPQGLFIDNFELTIFNRWGESIFQTTNATGWDGNINEKPAPEGVYAYRITYYDSLGQRFVKAGTVTLIR